MMKYFCEECDIGLDKLIDAVAMEMKKKLRRKHDEGYHGWDDIHFVQELWEKFEEHVDRGLEKDNMIDIMNLAAFLWNMADDAKEMNMLPAVTMRGFSEEIHGE
ncbi:MAG: hypothetical protein AB1401_00850 [Thermodesulfobacteriota bacterium]